MQITSVFQHSLILISSIMEKKRYNPLLLLILVSIILWMVSVYIFSSQFIDQSVTNLGRIANWSSFIIRNDAQYRKSHSAKDLSLIPLSTKKAFNSYSIKFPISFYGFYNNEKAIRIRSPLSEMRALPENLKWENSKFVDGDSILYSKAKTPDGTTLILVKTILDGSPQRKIELVLSHELTEYDDYFFTFLWAAFFFFAGLIGIIGFVFQRTTGNLINQIEELDFAVDTIKSGGKSQLTHLANSRFDQIKNLTGAIDAYVKANDLLSEKLSLTSKDLVTQSDNLTTVIKNQSESFMSYSQTISEVTASTEEIAQSSHSIAEMNLQNEDLAHENKTQIDESIRNISDMVRRMDMLENQSKQFKEMLEQNTRDIEEIANISGIIQNINEQLKLISFNAQIEAVAGKNQAQRFKVVANEVRELATTVEKSVDQIKKQIVKIIENTKASGEMFNQVNVLVNEGSKRLHVIHESMDNFSERATRSLKSAQIISGSTTEQMSALTQIVSSMNEMNNQTSSLYNQAEILSEKAFSLKKSGMVLDILVNELQEGTTAK